MKRILLAILAVAGVSATALAGGIRANTNHDPGFLRNPARGCTLDPAAVYFNPAGTAFMEDGFHFSLGNQFAFQKRGSVIDYAPFSYNAGETVKEYNAHTFAPLMPNIDFVWKHKRFSLMASFGVAGGGGNAPYKNGLGQFESNLATITAAIGALGNRIGLTPVNYTVNTAVKGYQVTFAGQIGLGYRINDWLSAAVQLRMTYVNNTYQGTAGDDHLALGGSVNASFMGGAPVELSLMTPAILEAINQPGADPAIVQQVMAMLGGYKIMHDGMKLHCEQTGVGFAPVLALYFNKSGWSAMAKYEFRTKVNLKNKTSINTTSMAAYDDGARTRYDQPAQLAFALSKRFANKLSLTAEWHYWFDKQGGFTYDDGKQAVHRNTNEWQLGIDWDVHKRWQWSCGFQYTLYGVRNGYQSELGFLNDALTIGTGFAFMISKNVRLNCSVARAIYFDSKVTTTNSITGLPYQNTYKRRNTLVGIGFDFKFAKK